MAALRAGMARDAAAAGQGFSSPAFYCVRKRDPLFRSAWIWAVELSAVEQREARRSAGLLAAAGADDIQPNNLRILQRRRGRGIAFTDARKQAFLDHFAGTADVQAACDAAGVHYSTVYKHRRTDARFAAGWDEALAQAYAQLEAEAVRQRLEGQRRAAFEPRATGEMTTEFERVMKLLGRWDRRHGPPGAREVRAGCQRRWTFDEAIVALDKRLRALGARRGLDSEPILIPPPPPPEEDE
ncbi:hypothetical protein ACFQRC_01425 [Enterovirga sp. GCM10030262]|uniref:hypothetical protein n=1 Tax=Enterovirga sp. GCM10030262 TaxID=3273391 RepID=UPI0036210288